MNKFILLLPFVISIAVFAKDISYSQIQNVKSNDVLNMREKSDFKSKKVFSIPYNAQCIVNYGCGKDIAFEALMNMQEDEVKLFLDSANEKWCYVKYQDKIGWVSKRYIKESTVQCK